MAGYAKLWSGITDMALPPRRAVAFLYDNARPLVSEEAIWASAGRTRRTGLVYFAQCGDDGPIKIGYAANPISRLVELQCGNPVRLRLVAVARGTMSDEKALHRRFAKDHLIGEWFSPSPDLFALIESVNR